MNVFSQEWNAITDAAHVTGADKVITSNEIKSISQDDSRLAGVIVPEGGKIWLVEAANTIKDRSRDVFSVEALEKFAADSNVGKTNLYDHDRANIVGRVLKGWTEKTQDRTRLMQMIWVDDLAMMPKQPKMTINYAIEKGILKDVSVGFTGLIKAIRKDGMPDIDHWLWYIDPESPDYTELNETSWVSAGCQRMAGVIKTIGNTSINKESNPKNMQHFSDKFLVGGELASIKTSDDGGKVKIEGIEELVKKTNEAFAAKAAAETAKTEADAAKTAAEAETKEIKDALTAEVVLLEKALGKTAPRSLEDLGKMKTIELYKSAETLRKEYDGNGSANGEKSLESKIPSYRIQ